MKILKKLVFFVLTVMMIAACQQEQRYFPESAETKTLESGIAAYESGDWDTWKSHFADTAKIYVNSNEPMTVDARIAQFKQTTPAWADYGFDKEKAYIEMVLDKEDETWVYYWAPHNGSIKATGKELSMPVHLAVQFKDGKIVEEHVFFDGTAMNKEMEAMNNMSADEKVIAENIAKAAKAWSTNDGGLWSTVTVPDLVRYDNGEKTISNQSDYIAMINANHKAIPDLKIAVDNLSIYGNKAYINWTLTGTNTGEMNGNPPTGKKVKASGLAVWEFNNDGKGVREDVFSDPNAIAMQLGYTLAPPK